MYFSISNFSYRKGALVFGTIFYLGIGAIALLNYTIDPYGSREWIANIRQKPRLNEHGHQYSYVFSKNLAHHHDTFIIGSSKVMSLHPAKSSWHAYTLWASGLLNHEKAFLIKKLTEREHIKEIYLSLDFFASNRSIAKKHKGSARFFKGQHTPFLSLATTKLSLETLNNMWNGYVDAAIDLKDGSMAVVDSEELIGSGKYDFSDNFFAKKVQIRFRGYYIDRDFFQYDEHLFDELSEAVKLARARGIKVHIFIPPEHPLMTKEMLKRDFIRTSFLSFREDVLKYFGPYQDFNLLEPELLRNENFYDDFHHRPILGSIVCEKLRKREGQFITDENIALSIQTLAKRGE